MNHSFRLRALCISLVSSAALGAPVGAIDLPAVGGGEWSRWRGPNADGVSPDTDWTIEGAETPLWSAEVGLGYSAVAIHDGRVYTLGFNAEKDRDIVSCLHEDTGEVLWTYEYPALICNNGHDGGTLSTPAVDDDRVYVKDREGKLFCLDAASGALRWSKDLKALYGPKTGLWGFASTPVVLDEAVIIEAGIVFAFDKFTGDLRWKTPDYGHAYSTPIEFTVRGQRLLAVMNATGLVVLDPAGGAEMALHEWKTFNDINAATPVVIDDRLFISSGANHGCAMLRWTGEGLETLWESKVLKTAMNAAVLWQDHLYGFDDGVLKCVDLDGQEKWSERGLGLGAMLIANGHLVILDKSGALVFARASPKRYVEVHRVAVLDGGKYWTTPIVTGGRIYCRNSLGRLVCLDHRRQS